MNREEIIRLLQQKDWVSLIEKFKNNNVYERIEKDEILPKIIKDNFVTELITGNSFANESAYEYYLQQFHMLHNGSNFKFRLGEKDYEKLIQKIVSEHQQTNKLNEAYKYAQEFPDNEICKKTIDEFNKQQSKIIRHSQSSKISLKQNNDIAKIDNTTSLFKSKQEYRFFKAVREVFPTYFVFPNIGINAVVNFDAIKEELTIEERRYFFMGLIDCVVIDQEKNYKPVNFVELDSFTHDNEKQQNNDKMKDKIIGLAGYKLYRIRSESQEITEDEFKSLIREKIKK